MRRSLALLCLCSCAMGCAGPAHTFKRVWLPTYLFGSLGGGDVDVRDLCPSGKAEELSVGSSWSTLGVSLATLGVYTPREVKVRCVRLP